MRVASCLYFASYELHLLCELRVASCNHYASCELRVERKVRVGNSKVRVETKSASCLFSFVERPFSSNKKGILKLHFNLQLSFGFSSMKSIFMPSSLSSSEAIYKILRSILQTLTNFYNLQPLLPLSFKDITVIL